MLTLGVKLKAEFVIIYVPVVDFLLIVQWIAVLICWRKQKNIAVFAWFDTIIEGQEFSTVIPDTSSCFEEKSASKTKFGVLFASGALIDV